MDERYNPYSAPRATVVDPVANTTELPSRWLRLAGALVDGFAGALVTMPIMWLAGKLMSSAGNGLSFAYQLGSMMLGFAVFLALHGWLLHANGQTIAKRLLGMKIVDIQTRAKPPLARLIGLRYLLPQIIYSLPQMIVLARGTIRPGLTPEFLIMMIGPLIGLVGILLIFGKDKRPLHDWFAGTQVVTA